MWGGKRPAGGGGGRGGGGYGGRGGGGGGSSSAHAAKRPKPSGDDDDDMGGEDEFIDEMLEDEEEMLADMSGPPPPEEDMDLAGKCLTVKDIDALTRKWKRPPLPPVNEAEQELSFQQLECDYTIANRPVEFARGSTEARAAAVRMYGVTNEGHSILAHIHGFLPYFWVKAPPGFTPEHAEKFKVTLNARVKAGLNARDMCEAPIVDVRLLARKSIMGYQFDAQAPFLRIVTALPSLVATCRRVLENGVPVPTGGSFQFETYESNWAYVLRFMVDREVSAMRAQCGRNAAQFGAIRRTSAQFADAATRPLR
jgi:DNA polymerase delta subunit 1